MILTFKKGTIISSITYVSFENFVLEIAEWDGIVSRFVIKATILSAESL